jgi:hypothetical protein
MHGPMVTVGVAHLPRSYVWSEVHHTETRPTLLPIKLYVLEDVYPSSCLFFSSHESRSSDRQFQQAQMANSLIEQEHIINFTIRLVYVLL